MIEPRTQLTALGLSDSEITVYLAMVSGARSVRDIGLTTRLKRPTIYYALGCLEKRGLVSKTGKQSDTRFAVESPRKLITLAREKSAESLALEESVADLVPFLTSSHSPSDKPSVAFFEGVDAVKAVIMEMHYAKKKHVLSVVPRDNFFWQVGREFVTRFLEERKRRGIHTRNLWDERKSGDAMRRFYDGFSEVRILPAVMLGKFKTAVFIYDDKTLYVASKKSCYAVLISSPEHAATMRAWFEGLWAGSKPHG